jgi:sarcosine oxidase
MSMQSLWAHTAAPAPVTDRLHDSTSAEVAVIGGGYTGLASALRLAEGGANVVVLEARAAGGVASGVNGGQVIPGLKQDPDELISLFGRDRGERLIAFVAGTVDTVFKVIERYAISCEASRPGWIQLAHSADALVSIRRRVEQWQQRGAELEMLDRQSAAALIGSDRYYGAGLDRRAGQLQPLSYARGLARAAIKAGARLYTDTAATSLARDQNRWRVTTDTGATVGAERVLLCTNAYTDGLWPSLRQTIIAANSFQIATPELPETLRKTILPGGHAVSDTRRLLRYFRRDASGRFLMGGRGPFREPRSPADFAHLKAAMVDLYPSLRTIEPEFHWGGRVALTRDYLPHLHEPAQGVTAFLGCNGRGVGLATAVGLALGNYLLHPGSTDFPFPVAPIKPIPFHGLQRLYVATAIAYYRFLDAV